MFARVFNRLSEQIGYGDNLLFIVFIHLLVILLVDELDDGNWLPLCIVLRFTMDRLLYTDTIANHLSTVPVNRHNHNGVDIGAICSPIVYRGLVVR